jgi:hypothetical protein
MSEPTTAQQTFSRWFLHFFQIVILTLPLVACGQEPSSYDPSKAPLLSEEKRREIDIILANELATWNSTSTRFSPAPGREAFIKREAFFRQLASEGYEVADIVAQIFKPSKGVIVNDWTAYERLRKLADSGDRSALCFAPFVFRDLRESTVPYTTETESKYTKRGVALGLPLCKLNEFYYYWSGIPGFPENHELAMERLREAAGAGLYWGQYFLLSEYRGQGFDDLHIIRKALCWGRMAEHHAPSGGQTLYVSLLQLAARDKNHNLIHPEFMKLAKEWSLYNTPYEAKPTTPEDCMHIEQEN